MQKQDLKHKLKQNKCRITPLTEKLIHILCESEQPISGPEILDTLQNQGIHVNKSSIYRQLDKFMNLNVLQEVNLNDGVMRYELMHDGCHHHAICNNCGRIAHVEFGEQLHKLQELVSRKTKFTIQEHMLEFFGLCDKCTAN